MTEQGHWDKIYAGSAPTDVSWYRPHLDRSLAFIERAHLFPDSAILDVGGGSSTLADDLLARGYQDITVLDISRTAIEEAQERLGTSADRVRWMVGDITSVDLLEHRYDFWHDRAVFHFLTDADARRRYVQSVRYALRPKGHIVVATFGPEGPERCSGLPVARYSPEGIHDQFGDEFQKIGSEREMHTTPWGAEQEFVYCYCRMPG